LTSGNVSEVTYFVSSGTRNLNSVNPSVNLPHAGQHGQHSGKWGQLTPWKNGRKIKSENVQKEQFSERVWGGVKAGVENGAMLTTYLFRYTSECTTS